MFFGKRDSVLGIDVGTSSVKIVELTKKGQNIELTNYVSYYRMKGQQTFPFQTASFSFFEEDVASKIKDSLRAAGISTKGANFAIPGFCGFFTTIELPKMEISEIREAIKYQSYKYIPLPLQEIEIDYEIIEENEGEDIIKTLVVAIPKDIIQKYQNVATLAGVNIKSLEVESFCDKRSLLKNSQEPVVIVNIGDRATNVVVVDKGYVRVSDSLDCASFQITKAISDGLNISFQRADEMRREKGITQKIGGLISMPIFSVIDKIIFGVQKAISAYVSRDPLYKPERIILSGGVAKTPGLCDYFYSKTNIKTEIGKPFNGILYNPALQGIIDEIGPSYSVAIGAALREFLEK